MQLLDKSQKNMSSKRFSLKRNFTYSLAGNLSYAFSQWIIVMLIAKFGTPEMVGRYSLGLAITAPVFLFLNVNLRAIQATDTKSEYNFIDYFYNRNITNLIGVLVVLCIISGLNLNKETQIIIFIMSICKFLETICDVSFGLFQQNERMDYVSMSKVIQSLLSILFVTFAIVTFNNLFLAVVLNGVSFLLTFIFYNLYKIYKITGIKLETEVFNIKNNFSYKKVWSLFIIGLPLGIAASLDSFNANIPRYFLQYFMNEKYVGYFSAIFFIMASGGTIITALAQSATPRLARLYNESTKQFVLLLKKLIVFAIVLGLLGIIISLFFGDLILSVLYSPDYSKFNILFILLMIAATIWYISSFIGTALMATRKFNSQMLIYIITTVVSIIGAIFLIPSYGLLGAGLLIILSHIARLIVTTFIYCKIIKNRVR
ncbi:oligosaccharide flippase family protein [Priestia sp. SIMBA_032]|uniref:oligosaccharide flippase family protein n=1 Tax=Priestia sp. SIMBA_032 TaxID=3085775 RepID=UPI0039789E11